jgi:hypothetical protein
MFTTSYPFTLDEFRRLTAYKAAVEAGFYTDTLPAQDAMPSADAGSGYVSQTRRQSTVTPDA